MSDLTPIKTGAAAHVHTGIYAALAAAQAEMGPVLKENINPAFKSRYADLANVIAACLPALNAHGISVFQPVREVDGARYVVTIFAHESGQTIENPVPLLVAKSDMQGLGSAITYARRYGLMAMAGVAPDDDDGNAAAANPPRQEQRRSEPPRQEQKAPEKPAPRDPKAIQQGLLTSIAKMGSAAEMDEQNMEGTRFAAAWQWLEDHHPDLSATVKATFDSRRQSLADAPSRGLTDDNIPY